MFDMISGIYSLFYGYQQDRFRDAVSVAKPRFDISAYESALDVGCGNGALCSVFAENGLKMTGVDHSTKMIEKAKLKNGETTIEFLYADALKGLPFDDDSFDFSIASYVAHGLVSEERKKLLYEMRRVSKSYVILHEFSKQRKLATDFIEWLEGGNYFDFIKNKDNKST